MGRATAAVAGLPDYAFLLVPHPMGRLRAEELRVRAEEILPAGGAILLAARRGSFAAEGLAVEPVTFGNLGAVLPPVVAGQLDAGTVSPSVDLFEALARSRGAPRVVASAGEAGPGFSPAAFVLRAD